MCCPAADILELLSSCCASGSAPNPRRAHLPIVRHNFDFPYTEPSWKRIRIEACPSDLAIPASAEKFNLIPRVGYDRQSAAFFAGRNHAVPLRKALPVLLQAPEFGLVFDAAYAFPGCIAPQPRHFEVTGQPRMWAGQQLGLNVAFFYLYACVAAWL